MSKINLNELDKYSDKEDFQRIKKHVNGDISRKRVRKNNKRKQKEDVDI